jgi:hypothetical protein
MTEICRDCKHSLYAHPYVKIEDDEFQMKCTVNHIKISEKFVPKDYDFFCFESFESWHGRE